jgi:hypothetical protein
MQTLESAEEVIEVQEPENEIILSQADIVYEIQDYV